jgi:hypothetical protein
MRREAICREQEAAASKAALFSADRLALNPAPEEGSAGA